MSTLQPVQQVSQLQAYKATNDTFAQFLKGFTRIDNEERVKEANQALKEARAKVKEVAEQRLAYTRQIDDLKKQLINAERDINAELSQAIEDVKAAVNAFKAEQERKAREEAARIQREADRKAELERIRNTAPHLVDMAVHSLVQRFENHAARTFNALTLETIQKAETQVPVTPVVSRKDYHAIFQFQYKANLITQDEYQQLVEELKTQFPYEKVNARFREKATAIQRQYREQLPEKRQQLLTQSEAERKAAAERTARQLREKQQREAQRIQEQQLAAALEAEVQAQFEAQQKQQHLKTRQGAKYKADIQQLDNRQRISVLQAALNAGYQSKALDDIVQKAADYLANHGQPKLNAITYKPA